MFSSTSIVSAIRRERKWVSLQEGKRNPPKRDTQRRRLIVDACVTILRRSPTDYSSWLRRDPSRRRALRQQSWTTPKAVKAVVALIDLAISDVESCATFIPLRPAGPLSIKERRITSSGTQLANLKRGRDKANEPTCFSIQEALFSSETTNMSSSRQRRRKRKLTVSRSALTATG